MPSIQPFEDAAECAKPLKRNLWISLLISLRKGRIWDTKSDKIDAIIPESGKNGHGEEESATGRISEAVLHRDTVSGVWYRSSG